MRISGRPGRRVPLDLYLRYRFWRRAAVCVVGVTVVCGFAIADRLGWLLERTDDWNRYHGKSFVVGRVIDGDTFEIGTAWDGPVRVRLWGIDTPELAREDKGRAEQPYAREATERTRGLCEGREVRLELQRHQMRGRYDRVLAYVGLEDGSSLNERLVSEGLAEVEERFGHDRMEAYRMLELEARRNKRGRWGGK